MSDPNYDLEHDLWYQAWCDWHDQTWWHQQDLEHQQQDEEQNDGV